MNAAVAEKYRQDHGGCSIGREVEVEVVAAGGRGLPAMRQATHLILHEIAQFRDAYATIAVSVSRALESTHERIREHAILPGVRFQGVFHAACRGDRHR